MKSPEEILQIQRANKTTPIMTIEHEWIILFVQLIALSLIAKLAILHLERTAREQGLHYI